MTKAVVVKVFVVHSHGVRANIEGGRPWKRAKAAAYQAVDEAFNKIGKTELCSVVTTVQQADDVFGLAKED